LPNVKGEPTARQSTPQQEGLSPLALTPCWAIVNLQNQNAQPQRVRFGFFLFWLVSFVRSRTRRFDFLGLETGGFDFGWFEYWRRRFRNKFCFAQR
jgi:hypothetical protein